MPEPTDELQLLVDWFERLGESNNSRRFTKGLQGAIEVKHYQLRQEKLNG